jgi:2-oxoisovalerate dehydrogenase E1 component beta subunit
MTWDQGLHASNFQLTGDQNALELNFLEAIREAMRYEMRRDPNVLLMGEDIATYGGAFKLTQGLLEEFGAQRVIDTPMAELCMLGVANGLALMGFRPIIEMQFADFISTGFDSIVQYAAQTHYRWGAAIPIVVRAPSGGGLRGGPFHSQSPEAWFVHSPGLKVVAPSTPADAWGLMLSAIRDPNPVIYFENKYLYRSLKGPVWQDEAHLVPLGAAHLVRTGEEISIISYGAILHEALAAADELTLRGHSVEVLDLRSLKPLDEDAILATARKTGKVLIVHEAHQLAGLGAEIASIIAQHAFESLDAPIMRLGAPDTPIPYSPPLEDAYRPNRQSILAHAQDLIAY